MKKALISSLVAFSRTHLIILLGFLADPINLVYSREHRRLVRYQGLSNLRGENSESLIVDIHYDYEQQAPLTGSALQPHSPKYSF